MNKRFFSFVISCALAFGMTSFVPKSAVTQLTSINASAETTSNGLQYMEFSPNYSNYIGYTIIGYTGTASELVIPEKINGKPVVSIDPGVFSKCETLKKVTLPKTLVNYKKAFSNSPSLQTVVLSEGILRIAEDAFSGCKSLKSVTTPSTLESIDDYAFNGCSALTSITIPKSVRYLGRQAFSYSGLKKVTVPSNVSVIQAYAFDECESLESVTLSKGIKELKYGVFYSCTALKSIVLPEGLTTLGGNVFHDCTSLADITIPKSLVKMEPCFRRTPWYDKYKEQELKKGTGLVMINDTLYDAPKFSGTSLVLPSNTKYVVGSGELNGPFTYAKNLTSVTLNEGLEGIGNYAFLGTNITKLKLPSTLKEIGEYKICPDNTVVTVASGNKYFTVYDNGLYDINKTILYHYPSTKKPTKPLPDGLKEIAINGFRANEKTTELTLPNTLNKIGTMALYNCKALKKLTVPASVTNIRFSDAFGCDGNGKISGFVCYGYEGSQAQFHCSNYGITFVSLGSCKHTEKVKDYDIDEETCRANKTVTRCTTCGKALTSVSTAAHTKIKTYHYCEADCVGAGFDLATCKICGDAVWTKTSSALGHNFSVKSVKVDLNYRTAVVSSECSTCKLTSDSTRYFTYQRFSGKSRYETAVSISGAKKSSGTVVLASGLDFPDALAGVPLAGKTDSPILLTQKETLPEATVEELKRLKPNSILILGGKGVISENVINTIKNTSELSGCKVTRVNGSTRYGTAVEVAKRVNSAPKEIFFVSGSGYPDALSAGTIAAIKKAPIIYLSKDGEIDSATAEYLSQLAKKKCVSKAYFIGGSGVISDDMMKKAVKALGLSTSAASRIKGSGRYETNLAVNRTFAASFDKNKICIAKGMDFPDALAGGAYAASNKTPLVLEDTKLSAEQKKYIKGLDTNKFYVFGGTGAVPDSLVKQSVIAAYK